MKSLAQKLDPAIKLVRDLKVAVHDRRDPQRISGPSTRELRTDMGPTALELGVTSQACCLATILALTAKKVRTSLKDLSGKHDVKVGPVKTDVIQEEKATERILFITPLGRIGTPLDL